MLSTNRALILSPRRVSMLVFELGDGLGMRTFEIRTGSLFLSPYSLESINTFIKVFRDRIRKYEIKTRKFRYKIINWF